MSFDEWLAEYGVNRYRVTEYDLEVAWNAAIDEAVKVALIMAKHKNDVDNLVGEVVAENIADNLKGLKE